VKYARSTQREKPMRGQFSFQEGSQLTSFPSWKVFLICPSFPLLQSLWRGKYVDWRGEQSGCGSDFFEFLQLSLFFSLSALGVEDGQGFLACQVERVKKFWDKCNKVRVTIALLN
jgi:hypothetical protein